jgi:SAM-dependent methyltransferase
VPPSLDSPAPRIISDQPHSAEYFGKQRDYWWKRDFLDLRAARWRLHEAASLADIGCGLGQWSRLLAGFHGAFKIHGVLGP